MQHYCGLDEGVTFSEPAPVFIQEPGRISASIIPKKMSPPPVMCCLNIGSPPYRWAKRAPKTGSAVKMRAVLVGGVNLCAWVWAAKANTVQKMAVTPTAPHTEAGKFKVKVPVASENPMLRTLTAPSCHVAKAIVSRWGA